MQLTHPECCLLVNCTYGQTRTNAAIVLWKILPHPTLAGVMELLLFFFQVLQLCPTEIERETDRLGAVEQGGCFEPRTTQLGNFSCVAQLLLPPPPPLQFHMLQHKLENVIHSALFAPVCL